MKQHQWEGEYIEALIDQLQPKGDVLQVGFSSGDAAERIQSYHPTQHTIIEPNPEAAERAMHWAKENPRIAVLSSRWEEALPKLGSFDAIFFDDFSPERERKQVKRMAAINQALQKGREIVSKAPEMAQIQYSNEDLDRFFSSNLKPSPVQIVRFLTGLHRNQQITDAQYEMKMRPFKDVPLEAPKSLDQLRMPDTMLPFLKSCLKDHLRNGGRFTCFAHSPLSKYENAPFFEEIITNPNCDYEEKTIAVAVPPSCDYYNFKEALVLLVVKQV